MNYHDDVPYDPFPGLDPSAGYANSNSFIGSILRAVGEDHGQPRNAVGWPVNVKGIYP